MCLFYFAHAFPTKMFVTWWTRDVCIKTPKPKINCNYSCNTKSTRPVSRWKNYNFDNHFRVQVIFIKKRQNISFSGSYINTHIYICIYYIILNWTSWVLDRQNKTFKDINLDLDNLGWMLFPIFWHFGDQRIFRLFCFAPLKFRVNRLDRNHQTVHCLYVWQQFIYLKETTGLVREQEIYILISISLSFKKHWLYHDFPIFKQASGKTLIFLWILSLVQLSRYIRTPLWWERYSTPTHLSFEPTGFVLGTSPPLLPPLSYRCAPIKISSPGERSARQQLPSLETTGEYCTCVRLCVWASVSVHKGLSCFNMQKRCQVCDYTSW